MTFKDVLAQVIDWLQQDKRITYRALKRQFDLDDEYLEDLKSELIQALHTGAFTTPMCRSQIYYLFFRQFQKQNLHPAFWKRSTRRGLSDKSYSRHH